MGTLRKNNETQGQEERGVNDVKPLTPGSAARIFRDGGVLEGMVQVPSSGPLELRHLAPGSYVCVDEQGGEQAFRVTPHTESVSVPTGGGSELVGGSAEPGSSFTQEVPLLNVGQQPGPELEPKYPPRNRSKSVTPADTEADDPVLSEPGSALIEESDVRSVDEMVRHQRDADGEAEKRSRASQKAAATRRRNERRAKRAERSPDASAPKVHAAEKRAKAPAKAKARKS